jgi:hypothetical protein
VPVSKDEFSPILKKALEGVVQAPDCTGGVVDILPGMPPPGYWAEHNGFVLLFLTEDHSLHSMAPIATDIRFEQDAVGKVLAKVNNINWRIPAGFLTVHTYPDNDGLRKCSLHWEAKVIWDVPPDISALLRYCASILTVPEFIFKLTKDEIIAEFGGRKNWDADKPADEKHTTAGTLWLANTPW